VPATFLRAAMPALAALLAPAALAAQQRDTLAADRARADSARRLPAVRVVVPGDAAPPSPLLAGTATSVVTAGQLAARPSRILPDALREVPGVQVQQTNAGHGGVIVRGFTGNQVLMMLDGVRLSTTIVRDGPNQYLATIDPERVAAVEVVRGPGSVLFGSDAMGGVVHVRTRRPTGRRGIGGALTASGADAGARAAIAAEGATRLAGRELRVRAGGTVTSAGESVAGGDVGEQPFTAYRSRGADVAAELDLARCARLDVAGQATTLRDVQRYDRLVRYRATRPGPDAEFTFTPQTFARALARVVGEGCGGRVAAHALTIGVQRQDEGRRSRGQDVGDDGAVTLDPAREYVRDDVATRFLTAWAEPRVGTGTTVRVGGDVYDDRVSSVGWVEDVATGARTPVVRIAGGDTVAAGRFPDGTRDRRLGAYVHASRLAGARARLLAGARWDRSRVTLRAGDDFGGDIDARHTALTGQLGAVVLLGRGTSATAHAGRGFRAPNAYDLSTVSAVPGGVVLPSAALGPERSTTLEAGLAREGGRIGGSVVAYRTRIADVVDRAPGTYRGDTLFEGDRVFRAANLGRARVDGAEAHVAASLDARWSVRAQASIVRGTQWTTDAPDGEPMTRIPPAAGSLALRHARGDDFWLEVVSRGATTQRRLSPRDRRDSRIAPGGTPGFVTVGARTGIARGTWRATLGLENLTDRGYREHGSGIDAPGRHAWLRLERTLGD
jgi:outer membrane receptor protein involved in Fe transport